MEKDQSGLLVGNMETGNVNAESCQKSLRGQPNKRHTQSKTEDTPKDEQGVIGLLAEQVLATKNMINLTLFV